MTQRYTRLGIWLMIAATLVFALQDGISRHLAGEDDVFMVVMIRFWFFALFVCVMVVAFGMLGLAESHVVFTSNPLRVAALSGPVLGETVGWRRWTAIGIGFAGVLSILQPGVRVFSPAALVPLLSAFMVAL